MSLIKNCRQIDLGANACNISGSKGNEDAKPDLITLNSLLNACAFTNYVDEKKATTKVWCILRSMCLTF